MTETFVSKIITLLEY